MYEVTAHSVRVFRSDGVVSVQAFEPWGTHTARLSPDAAARVAVEDGAVVCGGMVFVDDLPRLRELARRVRELAR